MGEDAFCQIVTCTFCHFFFCAGTTNQTKDGSVVRKCRVADRSGSVSFSLWNEQAEAIEPGDILRLTKGLVKSTRALSPCPVFIGIEADLETRLGYCGFHRNY